MKLKNKRVLITGADGFIGSHLTEKLLDENCRENKKIDAFLKAERKSIVVQGLGFVGSAMAAALANAKDGHDNLIFNVIGVDLPDEQNFWKVTRVNMGKPPVVST